MRGWGQREIKAMMNIVAHACISTKAILFIIVNGDVMVI